MICSILEYILSFWVNFKSYIIYIYGYIYMSEYEDVYVHTHKYGHVYF